MDDIDFDTVGCWRDDVRDISNIAERLTLPVDCEIVNKLRRLWHSMDMALDDAQGFNDPEPEPPVDEDKMKALQHRSNK